MSIFERLGQRWDRREEGVEPVLVSGSVSIAAPPSRVWEFLLVPEASLLTGDGVLKAFRVPGTPAGQAGEQQCIISESGGRVSAEVIELVTVDPLNCLVVRSVTAPNEVVERVTLEGSAEGGTVLTSQLGVRVMAGTAKRSQPVIRAHLDQALRRTRAAIESGARLPSERSVSDVSYE